MTVVLWPPKQKYQPVTVTGPAVYQIVVYGRDGVLDVFDQTTSAVISYGSKLSAPGQAVIECAEGEPGLSQLMKAGRPRVDGYPWVAIHRNGVARWRGFVESNEMGMVEGKCRLTLTSMASHLNHVTAGDAERTNHLVNGDFELGLYGWATNGDVTATIVGHPHRGSRCVQLVGGTNGGYLGQFVPLPTGGQAVWHAAVDQYRLTAVAALGLTTQPVKDGITDPDDLNSFRVASEDEGTVGAWRTLIGDSQPTPAGLSTLYMWFRLYVPPHRTVFYDCAVLARNDSVSAPAGSDEVDMVGNLVATGHTKLDLPTKRRRIATGRTLTQGHRYPHYDHPTILPAVNEWTSVEWREVASTDTFEMGPKLGRTRTDVAFGRTTESPLTEAVVTAGGVAPVVISKGPSRGDPVTDLEAVAVDGDPDMPWEFIDDDAPEDLTPHALDNRPRTLLPIHRRPATKATVVLAAPPGRAAPADWLERGFDVGDTVKARVTFAPYDYEETDRVVEWTVTAATDSMTAELADAI